MTRPHVLVIDAGLGNIGSVVAALQRQDCDVRKLKEPPASQLQHPFTHVVLPGVGAFAAGMHALNSTGWSAWIKNVWLEVDRPLLGICLGMQLLASHGVEGSQDGSDVAGLDLVPGHVERLAIDPQLALPHVGWNSLYWKHTGHQLSKSIPAGGDMYFVHSYAFQTFAPADCLAVSEYGDKFAAVVGRGMCLGVQFHPEKSQRLGRFLLTNFLGMTSC